MGVFVFRFNGWGGAGRRDGTQERRREMGVEESYRVTEFGRRRKGSMEN
jgi:hypothetical protein